MMARDYGRADHHPVSNPPGTPARSVPVRLRDVVRPGDRFDNARRRAARADAAADTTLDDQPRRRWWK